MTLRERFHPRAEAAPDRPYRVLCLGGLAACGARLDITAASQTEAYEYARSAGWRREAAGMPWVCPACRQARKAAEAAAEAAAETAAEAREEGAAV